MEMFKRVAAAVVAGGALLAAGAAHADTTWAWSYSGSGVSASGTFVTAGTALVAEDILSITGQRNGQAILGLVAAGADVPFEWDNQFTAAAPHFTSGGLLFDVGGGEAGIINLYYWAPDEATYDLYVVGTDAFEVPVTFNVTAVPEAATYAYMALGLAGLGLAVRRRKAA